MDEKKALRTILLSLPKEDRKVVGRLLGIGHKILRLNGNPIDDRIPIISTLGEVNDYTLKTMFMIALMTGGLENCYALALDIINSVIKIIQNVGKLITCLVENC